MADPDPQPFPPSNSIQRLLRHGINRIPSPGPESRVLTPLEALVAKQMTNFQRDRLQGFIINELQDAGCWDKADARASDLSGPLHPIFQKDRWYRHLPDDPQLPVGFGQPGVVSMLNESVWSKMQPALQLASRLVGNVHLWPWLDALMVGEHRPVDESTMDDGADLSFLRMNNPTTFWTRRLNDINNGPPMMQNLDRLLREMAPFLNFGFMPCTPERKLVGGYHKVLAGGLPAGVTPDAVYQGSHIYLAIWQVHPLLVLTLTESERLVQSFAIAKTLMHEVMHAAGWFNRAKRADLLLLGPEPFFEEEAMCELGRSWEVSVFGGMVHPMSTAPELQGKAASWAVPFGAMACLNWPNWNQYNTGKCIPTSTIRYRFPEKFVNGTVMENWPIQIDLIERMQQNDFWNVLVSRMGASAIRVPKLVGKRMIKQSSIEFCMGEDYVRFVGPNRKFGPIPPAPFNPTVIEKFKYDDDLRTRETAIRLAARIERRNAAALKQRSQLSRESQLRIEQQELLDSAYRHWDIDSAITSLKTYTELKTPFIGVAMQRNLAAFKLAQVTYGPGAGELDQQFAAREYLKIANAITKMNDPERHRIFKRLVIDIINIWTKDKTILDSTIREKPYEERVNFIRAGMLLLAQKNLDHLAPRPTDLGWVIKDFDYSVPQPPPPKTAQKRPADDDDDDDDDAPAQKKVMAASGAAVKAGAAEPGHGLNG